ncbi:MAG: sigma factor-like helix-turn-helix DNA-binding protein [Planctomycetota bacterium]
MADSKATQVRSYVKGLERDDRYIVLLYYADGLTPMEISRVLDLPTTKVRNRLDELRNHLAGIAKPKGQTTTQVQPGAAPTITAYA